jgi:hypothetical protein
MIQAGILNNNPTLVAGIDGLTKSFIALDNMGMLNAETFGRMLEAGQRMYTKLQGEVAALGGSTKDALLPMQGFLREAQKQAELLGIPLDANTQMLIDQSKELGIWKEKGKDANEKMAEAMDKVVDRLDRLLEGLGIQLPDAITDAADTIRQKAGNIRNEIDGIISRIPRTIPVDVDITYNEDGDGRNRTSPQLPGAANGVYATRPTARLFGEGGEPELGGPVSFMSKALAGALAQRDAVSRPAQAAPVASTTTVMPVAVIHADRHGEIDGDGINAHLVGPNGLNNGLPRELVEKIALRVYLREMSRRA